MTLRLSHTTVGESDPAWRRVWILKDMEWDNVIVGVFATREVAVEAWAHHLAVNLPGRSYPAQIFEDWVEEWAVAE